MYQNATAVVLVVEVSYVLNFCRPNGGVHAESLVKELQTGALQVSTVCVTHFHHLASWVCL